jgi:L-asparaginase II
MRLECAAGGHDREGEESGDTQDTQAEDEHQKTAGSHDPRPQTTVARVLHWRSRVFPPQCHMPIRAWVEQLRGEVSEATHEVHAVLCDQSGRVVAQVGDDLRTTFRSAAKPFQLEACLDLLGPEAVQALPDDLIAMGAASHFGEPMHEQTVLRLMHALGTRASDLLCGVHPPAHVLSYEALLRAGKSPNVVHHNCSGKHVYMATAARLTGADLDYRPAQHSVQRAVLQRIESASATTAPQRVVDGCGVPCFVLPLSAMARAYAGLRVQKSKSGGTLPRIVRAMAGHPWLLSGTGAFDLWLTTHGASLAKVGAGGLLCAALPGGLGMALKIASGVDHVRAAACHAVLQHVLPGMLEEALPEAFSEVRNAAGRRVGRIATRFAAG